MSSTKCEEEDQILHLDDLIQQHAYDECAHSSLPQLPFDISKSSPSPLFNSPKPPSKADIVAAQVAPVLANPSSFHTSSLFAANQNERVLTTGPVPPPASLRRLDASTNSRVVYPPKESCYKYVAINIYL
jgi:hypothetical protein